ncbi:MAG: hypothetical protein K9L30_14335 [Desulfobacterales bacterium]|nr:hypothetical protein [Desulfobacterales bacterium]
MITRKTWKKGTLNGFKTSFMLLKIIVPVFAAVTILGHTPVIGYISGVFGPIMRFTGLPGEAAIAFVTGAVVNIYAAIGIIIALNLTPWQITTIAVMLNLSHELVVESAILKKTGIKVFPIIMIRLLSAFLVGGAMNAMGKLIF